MNTKIDDNDNLVHIEISIYIDNHMYHISPMTEKLKIYLQFENQHK